MKQAIFLKFLDLTSGIVFPLIFKKYLRALTSPEINVSVIGYCTVFMILFTYFQTFLTLHTNRFIGISKGNVAQILRALFFRKILKANLTFT